MDEIERIQLEAEYFDPPEIKAMNMRNTKIPLDEYLLYFALLTT